MKISSEEINGMVILLNKLVWKVNMPVDYILAEANDIPELHGRFVFEDDEVKFITFEVEK